MSCPERGELLDLVLAGEDVPHLEECEDCTYYVEWFLSMRKAFGERTANFDAALEAFMDETLEEMPSKDWAPMLARNPEFHHSFVIESLLRRAARVQENPSAELDLTAAAVAVCEEMEKRGDPAPAQLFFDALKERAMALRAANELDAAIETLSRASAKASELENREQLDAIVALCTALTYSEADLGKFDEAIAMAERAEGVLELCGDHRRALMARQVKAHALACMSKFAQALVVVLPVARQFDTMESRYDAAAAHHLAAHCYAEVGTYDEALGHALVAQCGFEKIGNTAVAARAAHVAARAVAGLGRFDEARAQFNESAEIVFNAGLLDVWALDRLDYIAAALHHDPTADVRVEVEGVAMVCLTLGRENSTVRRRCAAEALDYLRLLAKRDALTAEVADYVRNFVWRNATRPPVRFVPPALNEFVM